MKKRLLINVSESKAIKDLRSNIGKHIPCPKCSRKKYVRRLKGKDKRYFCAKCRYKFSLKNLVGFKYSNLNYKQIYHLLHCFGNNKSHQDVIDWTGVSYPTSRLNYSRIRTGLKPHLDTDKLTGKFVCDECFVGKQKTNNQAIVMGAVDSTFTNLRLEVIPDREQDSIEKFLEIHIEPTSLIVSDAFSSYFDIGFMGYNHLIENHSKGRFQETVPIERVWGLFKTSITRSYHHIHKEKLPEYLVEFQFKFIHRKYRRNPLYIAKMLTKTVPDC
ncbi:MAG: IS1595 family transposase [Patescibacteria group bacterium]|nr:IS1595 family transposase [Patescibacteria group bacterium]